MQLKGKQKKQKKGQTTVHVYDKRFVVVVEIVYCLHCIIALFQLLFTTIPS